MKRTANAVVRKKKKTNWRKMMWEGLGMALVTSLAALAGSTAYRVGKDGL